MLIKINVPDELCLFLKHMGIKPKEFCEIMIQRLASVIVTLAEKTLNGEEITDEVIDEVVREAFKDLCETAAEK